MIFSEHHRLLERSLATASFIVAVALAFLSIIISEEHEIAGGNLMTVAQFLTFAATLLGIDYKFSQYDSYKKAPSGNTQQQPP
jgi:hypothetical protein